MKKIFIPLSLILLTGTLLFLPYRAWLERRLEIILEGKGFENVELTIASLGVKSASLKNISVGGGDKLNLKNIVLGYSLHDLWNGNFRDLSVGGVIFDVKQDKGLWVVTGLEGWNTKPEHNISEPLALPITPEQLGHIPFERMKLEDSLLNISFGNAKLSLPLELTWQKTPKSQFTYKGNDLSFDQNNLEITARSLTLDADIDEENKKWKGPWRLENINIKETSAPVPVMKGSGVALADQEHAEIEGTLISDDKLWKTKFVMSYSFNAPEESNLTIVHAHIPWKEGRIDVGNVKVPFEGKNPVKVTLQVQNVSIQELMQSLTGNHVSATGKVSGTLPLIIDRNGNLTVLQGNLKSEGPGMISMPPEAIPGNNEQVALVRKILEDLQYTGLSIAVENDNTGRLGVLMTFEGNNPAVYDGRPVKLNVNFTGDVLEFVQQNILLLTNPEQIVKQGNDEKN